MEKKIEKTKNTIPTKNPNSNTKILIKKIFVVSFIILSIGFVAFKVGYNKLMGNVYNISDINSNIDKIKQGDTINYTANGNSDWEVLYIDKDNKTIDIVSKKTVGSIYLFGKEGIASAIEKLQEEADKYATGENAISARSVAQSDLDKFSYDDKFWTADIAVDGVYYSSGVAGFIYADFENLMPVVTINVDDASSLNVGDEYSYELNGHSSWLILYKNSNTSISIIPKEPDKLNNASAKYCSELPSVIESILNNYRVSGVTSVRSINNTDLSALNSIQYFKNLDSSSYFGMYAENFSTGSTFTDTDWMSKLQRNGQRYSFTTLYFQYWGSHNFSTSSHNCIEYGYTLGMRPIVTLKFSDEKVSQKSLNTNLKIGDNVNYEAKEYNNWKVLSIDESNGTVDVISGGVVKNIVYTGLDDFNDISNKLQSEADEYKSGDRVISARIVNFGDFDNLTKINDKTIARYWTDNTYVYRTKSNPYYYYNTTDKKIYSNSINSSVGIGYYNSSSATIVKEWAILYTDASKEVNSSIMSPATSGPYSYMAGIRPVITLKIDQVEKVDESTVAKTNDESILSEQNSVNKSSSNVVSYKKTESVSSSKNDDIITSNTTVNDSTSVDYISEKEIKNKIKKLFGKHNKQIKYIILNLILIDLLIIYILIKIKNKNKENSKKTEK